MSLPENEKTPRSGFMSDNLVQVLLPLLFLGAWILLQAVILPRLGVST